MLNITHYQRNANQNHNEVPLHANLFLLLYVSFKEAFIIDLVYLFGFC